jgi:hypothetical protein
LGNFNQIWQKSSWGEENSKFFKKRQHHCARDSRPILIKLGANYPRVKLFQKVSGPLQRGHENKNEKIGWGYLKIFSRTTRPEELRST